MEIIEYCLKGIALVILIILFIGSFIQKTAVEGYEDSTGFHEGKQK